MLDEGCLYICTNERFKISGPHDSMDYEIPLLFSLTCLFLYFLTIFCSIHRKLSKLPPGPKPWPVVGNIFQLSDNPHLSLTHLSNIYGPLITLKLGSITTVVVSSVDMAREVFQKHDLSFSSRKVPQAAHAMSHYQYSIAWLPVSPKWRSLRKITSLELFNKKSLDSTELLRQEKVHELLEFVRECCRNGQAVDIGRAAFTTLLNLLSNTFFSLDLASQTSAASQEFKDIVLALLEDSGKPNLADYFPLLGYFDLFGIIRNGETYIGKFFADFDEIIQQKLSVDPSSPFHKGDVLSTLLKISKEEGSNLSLDDIKHLLLDLFVAGTDTASTTLEWAMTELLCDPAKMEKLQLELDEILGKDGRLVQESDIERLPYLQAVVKEVLRLHPPAPFLVPRKTENSVDFFGYIIPRNSQLLVNVWAINRDPSSWQNPTVFFPERFLESEIDFRGQHFEYLPFGAGRRICPGLPLAYRMLHLMLANLVHSFKWKLQNGMTGEDVDMTERFGLSLHKAKPLLAVPVAKY